jgi:hypothetical protein
MSRLRPLRWQFIHDTWFGERTGLMHRTTPCPNITIDATENFHWKRAADTNSRQTAPSYCPSCRPEARILLGHEQTEQ